MTKAEFLEQINALDDDELGMTLREALTDWLRTKADAVVGAYFRAIFERTPERVLLKWGAVVAIHPPTGTN